MPALLAEAAPEVLFIELPEEFAPWLEHLADPATVPPVALAGSGTGLVFLPFAEFSPELAAIRWAREAGVEVVPFDLPLGARAARGGGVEPVGPAPGARETAVHRAGRPVAEVGDAEPDDPATGARAASPHRSGALSAA
ncbi:DUF5682 family protein, partial [Streptomyces sp. NPDC055078]